MSDAVDRITEWFSALVDEAGCSVESIPFTQSAEWSVQDGFLAHRSKGFFAVIGLQWTSPAGAFIQRPFLDQKGLGTLGFLTRLHNGSPQLLVQAKIEPGNVGLVQLAPTCQATDSNAQRLHGGASPPFIDYFPRGSASALYDVEQSEQGTRFLRKRNRNVLASAEGDVPLPDTHRWLDAERLLDLSRQEYLINTDARSALVCAPWQLLVNRIPFSRYRHRLGRELMSSALSSSRHVSLDQVKAGIREARAMTADPTVVGLEDLRGWRFKDEGLVPVQGDSMRIKQIRVTAKGREVPAWDQPIIDSGCEGQVLLVCGRLDGVLHFLFRAQAEAGLPEKVELTPTAVVEPGEECHEERDQPWQGTVVAECRQSEEGGRFYQDTNLYRLIDIGDASPDEHAEQGYWLTLGDIRRLLDEPGWLTNEARSSLSLLLPWM